jgi:hypothetical protein
MAFLLAEEKNTQKEELMNNFTIKTIKTDS